MRLISASLCIVFALAGMAHADDAAPKVTKVSTLKALEALDRKATTVQLSYFKGGIAALHARAPALTSLRIISHSSIPLEDLRHVADFAELRDLTLGGDMTFPTTHLAVVGSLAKLTRLQLGLP